MTRLNLITLLLVSTVMVANANDPCPADIATEVCAIPPAAFSYSVVTFGDANIAAHSMYYGIAVGGTLTDGSPNESATVDKTKSYIKEMKGKCSFNFNGGKQTGDSCFADNLYDRMNYIATHAQNSTNVVVYTSGGSSRPYTVDDFVPGGDGNDDGLTLAVFNTYDDIYIADYAGRQFGPTIIAPNAKVIVLDGAGYVDGAIYAKELDAQAGNLQLHGDTFTGTINCGSGTDPSTTDDKTGSTSGCGADPVPSGMSYGTYSGNPQCVSGGSSPPFGFDYGWKMNGCQGGSFTLDAISNGQVKGSCGIADKISVTVQCNSDKSATISWSGEGDSNLAIKMKGGNGGVLYDNTNNGGNFFAATNSGGNIADISHIEICVNCVGADCYKEPTNPAPTPVAPAPTPATPTGGYCNYNGCNGVEEGGDWCNKLQSNCEGNCNGQWCGSGGPAPTPATPTGGYCNYNGCNGVEEGGDWCNQLQSNCEGNCNGQWCGVSAAPPTGAPTAAPTSSPTDTPTAGPTGSPTATPTAAPTGSPTAAPTGTPTAGPTGSPTLPTTCPDEQPNPGSACGFGSLECAYGTETCCDGSAYDSYIAQCADGVVVAYHTDACMSVVCVEPTAAPTSSPTGTPTASPTGSPTAAPTGTPTAGPTGIPTLPTTCPDEQPNPGSACGFGSLECAYGTETCCDGSAYDSFIAQCSDGVVVAYHTDACMSVVCVEPTTVPTATPTAAPTSKSGVPDSPSCGTKNPWDGLNLWEIADRGIDFPSCGDVGQINSLKGADLMNKDGECKRVNVCHGNAGNGWTPKTVDRYAIGEDNNGQGGLANFNQNNGVNKRPNYFPGSQSVANPNGGANGVVNENCDFVCDPCEEHTCDDGTVVKRILPTCAFAQCPDDQDSTDVTTDLVFTRGDPHFKTFGGELYDFHGECDLVLLRNPEFKNKLGMDVHIRTKITDWWSSVESAAVRIGDSSLEIFANDNGKDWLWINGQVNGDLQDGKWNHAGLSGFMVRYKETDGKFGLTRQVNIYLEGVKEVIILKTFKSFVRVDIDWKDSENYYGSTGLLGSHAHNGARLGRDGEAITDLNAFGQEWQVLATEPQLFHSYDGAVLPPNKCILPDTGGAKQALRKRRLAEGMPREEAEAACNHLVDAAEKDACVYDVLATQDLNLASAW